MESSTQSTSSFRIQSRDIGATWSQVTGASLDVFQEYFRSLFPDSTYICISEEKHKDGGLHYHGQFQFEARKDIKSAKTFNFKGSHPHLEKTNDSVSWNTYVKKEKCFVEWGEFQYLLKRPAAKTGKEAGLMKKKLTNKELLEGDLVTMVDTDQISLYDLGKLIKARSEYALLKGSVKPTCEGLMPSLWDGIVLEYKPLTCDTKQRHIWLWSDGPNKGKTTFLKKLDSMYRCFWYNPSEKFQNNVLSNGQFMLFDEMNFGRMPTASALNSMCDNTFAFPIKGGSPVVVKEFLCVVCSNKPIATLYPNQSTVVKARFLEFCLNDAKPL